MRFNDYLGAISNDSELLITAAQKGLQADVPACPGWNVRDVVAHVGQVHRSKEATVSGGHTDNRGSDDVQLPSDDELIDWFAEGATKLLVTLAAADPATPVWTWDAEDHTVGFWYRRMAHETFIHRVDAEQAHGPESPADAELCADGIEEMLTKFIGGPPEWGKVEQGEGVIELRALMRNWLIRRDTYLGTTPSGKIIEEKSVYNPADPHSVADTTIFGSTQAINLWLWGRGSDTNLAITGDVSAADQLRADAAV